VLVLPLCRLVDDNIMKHKPVVCPGSTAIMQIFVILLLDAVQQRLVRGRISGVGPVILHRPLGEQLSVSLVPNLAVYVFVYGAPSSMPVM
jgi:hypothetical protein